MTAKRLFLAVAASLSLGAMAVEVRGEGGRMSQAEAIDAPNAAEALAAASDQSMRRAWVAHAEAVFAAADARNLALANASDERAAWITHAEAVFRAADEYNLAIAQALDSAHAARERLVESSVVR